MLAYLLRLILRFPWKIWTLFPNSVRRCTYNFIAQRWGVSRALSTVTRLPFGLALKHTYEHPPHIEADSTRFVRRNTALSVPDILDIVPTIGKSSKDGGLLLMSWIEGERLGLWLDRHVLWPPEAQEHLEIILNCEDPDKLQAALDFMEPLMPELDVPDDHPLLVDLRNALTEIRSLLPPSSGPQICNVSGGPTIWARCYDRSLLPPVNTVTEFHELLFQQVSWKSRLERLRLIAKPVHSKTHRIMFTHSDLNPNNILVNDDRLAGIIDWEFAGWYPEYWEYTQLVMQNLHLRPREVFWGHVGFFSGRYTEELQLERALWHSTGEMSIAPGVIPNDPLDQPLDQPWAP